MSYWETRYALGGTSGVGSVGEARKWKWNVITEVISTLDHVIDVGCGDLTFWEGRDCKDYVGIDISKTITDKNKLDHPKWSFINAPAERYIEGLKNECVICLDVLFHIIDSVSFIQILDNLCRYSTSLIFIHTWIDNPFGRWKQLKHGLHNLMKLRLNRAITALRIAIFTPYKDGSYQYFRSLEQYMDIFERNGFKLLDKREKPDKYGCLYIFKAS